MGPVSRPAASTTVRVGRENRNGLGYAERLILTSCRAKTAEIRELRWARFDSQPEREAILRLDRWSGLGGSKLVFS